MNKITASEVKASQDRNEDVHLINVLAEEQFRKKHIPGSVNVPLAEADFIQEVERIVGDKEAKVIVYCADENCNASPKAAKELADAGYVNLYDFEGGVAEWEQAGFPLEGAAVNA